MFSGLLIGINEDISSFTPLFFAKTGHGIGRISRYSLDNIPFAHSNLETNKIYS